MTTFKDFYTAALKIKNAESPEYKAWEEELESKGDIFIDLYREYAKSRDLDLDMMNIEGSLCGGKETIKILKESKIKRVTMTNDSFAFASMLVDAGAKIIGMKKVLTRKKSFGCNEAWEHALIFEI